MKIKKNINKNINKTINRNKTLLQQYDGGAPFTSCLLYTSPSPRD